jgi:hypothetical protein
MADVASIPQIAPFIPNADPTSVSQRWKRWSDRFDNLIVAMNVTNHARKKALLLHLAGDAVFDMFSGLVIDPVPADADEAVVNVYTIAKKALDNHFNPKHNGEFERSSRLRRRALTDSTLTLHTHTSVLTPFSPRSGVSVRLPMTKNQIPHFAMHPYPVHHHAVTLLSPCPSPLVPSIPSAVDPFLSHLLPQTLTPS